MSKTFNMKLFFTLGLIIVSFHIVLCININIIQETCSKGDTFAGPTSPCKCLDKDYLFCSDVHLTNSLFQFTSVNYGWKLLLKRLLSPKGLSLSALEPIDLNKRAVSKLIIQESCIKKIDTGFFSIIFGHQLRGISLVDITCLPSIHGGAFQGMEDNLEELFIKNVTNVNINNRWNLPALHTLHIANSKLTTIPDAFFADKTKLFVINLQKNQLTSLPRNILTRDGVSLSLSENPWICDCRLRFFLRTSMSVVGKETIICDTPLKLKGQRLIDLDEREICTDEDDVTETVSVSIDGNSQLFSGNQSMREHLRLLSTLRYAFIGGGIVVFFLVTGCLIGVLLLVIHPNRSNRQNICCCGRQTKDSNKEYRSVKSGNFYIKETDIINKF